jgi:excinuclease ABC subunit C
MMAEVIGRLIENERDLSASLDLLLLDGGKGQLNKIVSLLKQVETPNPLPVASIAKERESEIGDKGKGHYEKIYLPGRKNPLFLHRYPDILHLLQRIRDEAHRFAITHYQNVHRTSLLTSALDGIPGIGPGRRQMLLQRFGSVDAIQEASASELESAGLPGKVAQNVVRVLSEIESREVLSGQESGDSE